MWYNIHHTHNFVIQLILILAYHFKSKKEREIRYKAMPINKFFSYLYGRYRTFILIGAVIAVVSAYSSYRQISSRGKEQRKKRETIRSLSQEELDFECQKIIQR